MADHVIAAGFDVRVVDVLPAATAARVAAGAQAAATPAEAAPDARILIMLRDPVERYHSGLEREARLYEQAGTFANIAIVGDAIYRSMYHRQVQLVLESFGRERVLVLQYEPARGHRGARGSG